MTWQKKKGKFKVAGEGVIIQHLAPAAEKNKSVVFKGRPEARKWLRGEKGKLFPVKRAQEKDQPPAAERLERREKE